MLVMLLLLRQMLKANVRWDRRVKRPESRLIARPRISDPSQASEPMVA